MRFLQILVVLGLSAAAYLWFFNKPDPIAPVGRLAPEGVLYVTKPFSVITEDGIVGFPAGKKVRLLRSENEDFIVSDGKLEAKASVESFTNNLDEVDALRYNAISQARAIEQSRLQQQRIASEKEALEQKAHEQNRHEQQKQKWSDLAAALKAERDAVNKRISAAARERQAKGYPRYGGTRYGGGYHSTKSVSIGVDASQIEQLIKAKDQVEAKLKHLESVRKNDL